MRWLRFVTPPAYTSTSREAGPPGLVRRRHQSPLVVWNIPLTEIAKKLPRDAPRPTRLPHLAHMTSSASAEQPNGAEAAQVLNAPHPELISGGASKN
jgi:hypothetical protein